MTVVAQIDHSQNPAMVQMVVDYGEDDVPKVIEDAQKETPPGWVDVTSHDPRPGPDWTFDGTSFTQPPDQINQETVAANIRNAITQNTAYLALTNPTTTQQSTQIKRLTQQVNALARQVSGQFDAAT